MLPQCWEGQGDERKLENDSLKVALEPAQAAGPDAAPVPDGPGALGQPVYPLPCFPPAGVGAAW